MYGPSRETSCSRMTARHPLEVLVGPEDCSQLRAIASGRAPRLDYRLVADQCQGSVRQWFSSPAGLRGPRLVRLSRSLLGNFGCTLRLVSSLGPASIVYATGETWGLPVAVVSGVLRRRFVHVVYAHRVYSPSWLRLLRLLAPLLHVDGWICVNRHQAHLLRQVFPRRPSRVAVVSQGVDTAFWDPARATPPDRKPYILAIGAEMRNYPLLFDAVRGMDVEVRVKASSAWMNSARHELRSLPTNVTLLRERLTYSVLRDLYAGAALVAVPLYDTPQAAGITTILEAMAMGVPVIATQSAGLPDGLVDGETGIVVAPEAGAVAEAITEVLGAPTKAAALAASARQFVESDASIEAYARRIAGFLQVVQKKGDLTDQALA